MNLASPNQADISAVWQPFPGMDGLPSSQMLAVDTRCNDTLLTGTRGGGKMQPLDSLVLTYDGWVRMGDVHVGSMVMTPRGVTVPVTHVYDHSNKQIYKVTFHDGSSCRAGGEHLWKFKVTGRKRKAHDTNFHVNDTIALMRELDAGNAVLIPTVDPIPQRGSRNNAVDPYLLGVLLGDGSFQAKEYRKDRWTLTLVRATSVDSYIQDYLMNFGFRRTKEYPGRAPEFYLNRSDDAAGVYDGISKLKLHKTKARDKFVPKVYLHGKVEDRIALLQGLLDTDGTATSHGHVQFTSISEQLALDVRELAWSLGATATITGPHKSMLNGVEHSVHYDVQIQPSGKFQAFRLRRKQERVLPYQHGERLRRVRSIEPDGIEDARCIQIDDLEHLYVTDDYVVTHNTEVQIMRFRRHVGVGYGNYWRGIIFDREYKSLDDIVTKTSRLFKAFGDGAQFMKSKADYRWIWPTGEELLFRVMRDPEDYWNYHGHEYPFIGWNELTKWPTAECFNAMLSCNRSSFRPSLETNPTPIPLEVVSTTNPYGAGHNWVKQKYIDPAEYGEVVENVFSVTPIDGSKPIEIRRKQVAIFSSYKENPFLDASYEANLLQQSDPNRLKAWLTGSWDITAGGIIDDLLDVKVHRVPRFVVPSNWPVDRSFDWGSSHPFSVGWYTVANGEEVEVPGKGIWCPVRGSLIRIGEWYGAQLNPSTGLPNYGANEGLRWGSGKIAKGILDREDQMIDEGWLQRRPSPGPADTQIYNVSDADTDTIAKIMERNGVRWIPADKAKGSRINGLQLMRDMLIGSLTNEGRGFYFTPNNRAFMATTATLPRDSKNPDDADTEGIDHDWDQTRYRVLWLHKVFQKVIDVQFVA